MNLVKAELNRFFSRRFIQIMLVVLVAAFGVTVYTVMSSSKQPTPAMWQQAEQHAEQDRKYRQQEHALCLQRYEDNPAQCAQLDPSRIRAESYLWQVFSFSREIKDLIYLLGVFLAFFGFLVTASFVGSELHSGGMTNLLLWRPNRVAVLGAKFGVVLGLVAVISTIFTTFYVGTFYGIANATGWVGDTGPPFWTDLIWLCLRAVALAVIVSAVGFAVATVGRHTAAALGGLIAYGVVWEIGVRIVLDSLNSYSISEESAFLSTYFYTWLADPRGGYDGISNITFGESATVLTVLVALSTAVAFLTFRRRDLA